MGTLANLAAATASFVGMHFLLSHPLRRPIVALIGEGPFLGLYSLIALLTFGWMIVAARAAPEEGLLWTAPDWAWGVGSAVMLIASIFFAGSLIGNPATPDPARPYKPIGEARGVYAITRHPMMWAFSLWAIVHVAVWPTLANLILAGGIFILAFFGMQAQDRKKEQLIGGHWRDWERATSFWPFAALLSGRTAWSRAVPSAFSLAGGLGVWLLATAGHGWFGSPVVGLWRWLG